MATIAHSDTVPAPPRWGGGTADTGTTYTPARLGAHELVLLHGQPGSPRPAGCSPATRPGRGSSPAQASAGCRRRRDRGVPGRDGRTSPPFGNAQPRRHEHPMSPIRDSRTRPGAALVAVKLTVAPAQLVASESPASAAVVGQKVTLSWCQPPGNSVTELPSALATQIEAPSMAIPAGPSKP
jgi:hypothetical protein